ncbi:hypothetical protein B9Z65_1758 [Elsinoe australis]|uniref:Chromatin assembly factor 1 subunit A n=1 Tax=Elsinoe australis TaxID=40998 RepID=A0A2P7YKW3_9PEZI|nr:hypothetical protein B9Z65_1758 [Elsinoe australis]
MDSQITTTLDNPLKRSLDDFHEKDLSRAEKTTTSEQAMPTPPHSLGERSHDDSPTRNQREASPALSTSTLSSLPTSTAGSNADSSAQPALNLDGTTEPPKKKRKLTPAEKLQKDKDKAERARLREERRVQKEAEAAVKAEERRVKNEEKEVKQRERDLVKQQKEEEKRKKEEEIAKKQRAQSRLGSFFKKPTPTNKEASTGIPSADEATSHASETQITSAQVFEPREETNAPPKTRNNDYHRFFLPFSLPQHTKLAPTYRASSAVTEQEQDIFDNAVLSVRETLSQSSDHVTSFFSPAHERIHLPPRASRIHELLQGSLANPVDLTLSHPKDMLQEQLGSINMKHIHFSEDVRPPYTGSYTKITNPARARKLARAPTSKQREDTNYDYDSEAEWEEPEEGEDVGSDEEEDAESVGSADEMEEFLDDGDDAQLARNRKLITSELEPVSSGVCWEHSLKPATTKDAPFDLSSMRLEWLLDLDTPIASINPFSDSYWAPKAAIPTEPAAQQIPALDLFGRPVPVPSDASMRPPRTPLQPTTNGNQKALVGAGIVGAVSGAKGPIMAAKTPKAAKAAAAKLTGRDFEELREAVVGSDLTKSELLKALKLRFPKFTNDSIKETVTSQFARVGPSASEKRWRVVAES